MRFGQYGNRSLGGSFSEGSLSASRLGVMEVQPVQNFEGMFEAFSTDLILDIVEYLNLSDNIRGKIASIVSKRTWTVNRMVDIAQQARPNYQVPIDVREQINSLGFLASIGDMFDFVNDQTFADVMNAASKVLFDRRVEFESLTINNDPDIDPSTGYAMGTGAFRIVRDYNGPVPNRIMRKVIDNTKTYLKDDIARYAQLASKIVPRVESHGATLGQTGQAARAGFAAFIRFLGGSVQYIQKLGGVVKPKMLFMGLVIIGIVTDGILGLPLVSSIFGAVLRFGELVLGKLGKDVSGGDAVPGDEGIPTIVAPPNADPNTKAAIGSLNDTLQGLRDKIKNNEEKTWLERATGINPFGALALFLGIYYLGEPIIKEVGKIFKPEKRRGVEHRMGRKQKEEFKRLKEKYGMED